MKTIHKSTKLANVLYDVRGPIVDAARQMEDEGLVSKKVFLETPPRVEYSLTEKGAELVPAIKSIEQWSLRHYAATEGE